MQLHPPAKHSGPQGDLYGNNSYHGPSGRTTWLGTGDWFHPNDAGHAAIATRVAEAVTPLSS